MVSVEHAKRVRPKAAKQLDDLIEFIKHKHSLEETERFIVLVSANLKALDDYPDMSRALAALLAEAVVRLAKHEAQAGESSHSA